MLLRELFKAKEDSLQEFDLGSVWTGIKTLGKGLLSAPAAAAQIALTPSSTAKYDTMDAASSVYQGALDKGLSGAEAEKLAQDFEKSLKANPNDPKVKQIHSQYAAWDDNFNEIPGSTKVAKPATDIKPDLVVKPKVSTAPVDDPTTKIPQISKSEKPVDPKDFEKAIAGNDVKKVSDAIPNVVANTMAADKLATQTFKNPTEIEQGIKSVVGNKMPASNISALAATAAKYAIPAAGVVALLYGGKKLYDYLTKEESMKNNESIGEGSEDTKEAQIKAWANKYKKYEGGNGDSLPAGFLEEHLNTGVPWDSIEAGELERYKAKYGDDALEDLSHEQVHDNPDEFPITHAFLKDLEKIFGYIPHGDEVEEIADVLKYYDGGRKGIKEDEGSLDQFRSLYKKSIGSDDAAVTLRELIQAINDDALWSDKFPQLKKFVAVSPNSGSKVVTAKKIPGDSADEKIAALVTAIDDDEWVNDTAKHLMRSFTLGEDDNIEEAPFGKAVKSALGRVAQRTATNIKGKLGSIPGMGDLKTAATGQQAIDKTSDQVWNQYVQFKQTGPDKNQTVNWFKTQHGMDISPNELDPQGNIDKTGVEKAVKSALAKKQSGVDKEQQPNQPEYQFKKGDEIKWTDKDGKQQTARVVDPDKGPGGQQNMMTVQQGNRGTIPLSKDKPFPADSQATQDDKVAIAQLQKIDPTANQTTLRAVNSVAGGKAISGQLQQFIQPLMKKISRALKDANKRQKLAVALSESLSQSDLSKLDILAREGLVDKKNVTRFKTAMRILAKEKELPISYKDDVIGMVSKLAKIITKPSVMGMVRKGLKEEHIKIAQEKFRTWVKQHHDKQFVDNFGHNS